MEGAVQKLGFFSAYLSSAVTFDSNWKRVDFDSVIRADGTYYSMTTNGVVHIEKSGWYRVSYSLNWDQTANARDSMQARARVNGTEIPYSLSHCYMRGTNYARRGTNSAEFIVQINAGDNLEIWARNVQGGHNVNTIANSCWVLVEKI